MRSKLNMVERCPTVPTDKSTQQPHLYIETIPSVPYLLSPRQPQLIRSKNQKPWRAVMVVAFLLACVSINAGQTRSPQIDAVDEISMAGRPRLKGTIVGMSRAEVTVDANRAKVSLPINEIVAINYALEPIELRTARRLARGRNFDGALRVLDKITPAQVSRDLIAQDVEYYRAYSIARLALSGKGDKDAAIKALKAFASEHKNNYHFFSAMEMLSELAVANGQPQLAKESYDEVAKAPWPAYKLRALALEGDSLHARKNYTQAIEKYDQVIRASKDIPGADEPRRRATLSKMAVLVETNNYPQIRRRQNAELHASATMYYGDGSCCCWDIDVWQMWGMWGNMTYVDAQVTTPGVTVTSVSDPIPGPGSQNPVLLSGNTMRWFLPLPNGLWMAPQTLTACFSNVPASGASVTLIGYDSAGNTDGNGLQTTTVNISENGECSSLPDFWMKDTMTPDLPEDFGVEPNSVSQYLWISQDIWVRNVPDTGAGGNYANEHQHQNPVYVNASSPNYVYVKVRNRGNYSNLGSELLRVYWADANTGLPWPSQGTGLGVWNEIDCDINTTLVDPCPLPNINPGQDYVMQLPWVPPDPSNGNGHFCLVARIETMPYAPFGMKVVEGPTLWQNVANNNNIAWKNVTVVTSGASPRPSKLFVRNTLGHEAPLTLRFSVPDRELGNHFLLHGDIVVDLGELVMEKWRRGGHRATGFAVAGKTTIRITDPSKAEITGLLFESGEQQTIQVRMELRRGARVPAGTTFNWDIVQLAPLKKNGRSSVMGGERYVFTINK